LQQAKKAEGEVQKFVTVQRLDKDTFEFTYKESQGESILNTLAIKISMNDLIVMQKMLEVFLVK